ncbi:MAG: hypothetical protein NVSMB55_18750 [Mycobacteriales bacterium]
MSQLPGRPDLARFGAPLAIGFIAAGIVVIGIGYNGAASDARVGAQIPYLLSGLGLGLALVITGAAVMISRSAREDSALLTARIEELMLTMPTGSAASSTIPSNAAGLVVAGSASYHVPECRLVDGREEVAYLTPDEARARDLRPCRVCQPDSEPSNVRLR